MTDEQIFAQAVAIARANRCALEALPRKDRPAITGKLGSVVIGYYLDRRLNYRYVYPSEKYKETREAVLNEIGAIMSIGGSVGAVALLQQAQEFDGKWYVLPIGLSWGVACPPTWPDWAPAECYS